MTAATSAPNELSLIVFGLPVELARVLALVLLAAGGLGYVFASRRESGTLDVDQADADAVVRALGDRVVEVERLAPTVRIADVATVAALVRLADVYERVVLHARHGDAHIFAVDEGDVSYRLRVGTDVSDDALARLRLDAGAESLR